FLYCSMKLQVSILRTIHTLLFILSFYNSHSQNWPKIYGDNIRALGYEIMEEYDHGYQICGSIMKDANLFQYGWIIKTDINGSVLWDKKFGHPAYENFFLDFDGTDDEGIIACGATAQVDSWRDPLFVKLDACGEMEWCKIYLSDQMNHATGVIHLPDGQFLGMLEYYGGDAQHIRISLVKMDAMGDPVWIKHLAQADSTIYNEEGYNLNSTLDGNLLVTGECFSPNLKPFYIKTDTSGMELWDIKWPAGTAGYAKQSTFSSNGMIYSATGLTFPGHPKIPYLLKFTTNGAVINQYPLMGDTIIRGGAESILLVGDTNLYVGLSWTDDPTLFDGYTDLQRTDTSGNLIIQRRLINGGGSYPPQKIIRSFDDKILAVGHYYLDGNWDIYMWKMNENLEDDTLYTQPMTYDSLCPYEIQSDTLELDCGLFVNIDEIPTKEQYESSIKISPNPASDWVVLTLPDVIATGAVELTVYNILGKEEIDTKFNPVNRMISLDTSSLSSGMYLVVCKDQKNRILTEKLIIK
ncbi:MAG TPA: T9SS type A sorting domain-containing protein, partial [Bacteroidales bacterium]|nr:T9SS type A sorting domain-containing protein [Bacteroidales bacterium]